MAPVFYYDLSSPYAYLSAECIDQVLGAARWQPIAFGPLIVELGRVPWSLIDGEREAGIAEVERRALARGLPPVRWHEGWPDRSYSVMGAKAALWAEGQGAQRELALAMFRRSFVDGSPLNAVGTLLDCARSVGLDASLLRSALAADELKASLRQATSEAIAAGVIGIPTVQVGKQLFWGDDQLELAAAAL